MIYKGKEPCQGCGKPGSEKHRWYKDRLCSDCQIIFDKFKASEVEATTMKYVRVSKPRHGVFDISSRGKINLSLSNMFVDSVLIGFNNPNAKPQEHKEGGTNKLGSLSGGYYERYIIPEIVFNSLKRAVVVIEEAVKEIREQQDAAFVAVNTQLEKERDKIYNAGIEKGRSLLFQLNSGDISANEFNNNYSYNEKNK